MKGPSSQLYLVLGLVLAASVSCKSGADKQATQATASESQPAPADTGSSATAPAAAATVAATATTTPSSEKPKSKTAPAVDSTVKATVDTAHKGPTSETALLGQTPPAAKPPVPMIPGGATAECHDSTYSMSQDKTFACKGHGGVMKWLKM